MKSYVNKSSRYDDTSAELLQDYERTTVGLYSGEANDEERPEHSCHRSAMFTLAQRSRNTDRWSWLPSSQKAYQLVMGRCSPCRLVCMWALRKLHHQYNVYESVGQLRKHIEGSGLVLLYASMEMAIPLRSLLGGFCQRIGFRRSCGSSSLRNKGCLFLVRPITISGWQ